MKILLKIFITFLIIHSDNIANALNIEIDILNSDYKPVPVVIISLFKDENSSKYGKDIEVDVFKHLDDSSAVLPRFSNATILSQDDDLSKIDLTNQISKYYIYSLIITGKMIFNEQRQEYNLEVIITNSKGLKRSGFGYIIKSGEIKNQLPLIAGDIANTIYSLVTNSEGYFLSSLVYSSGRELILADYKGTNKRVLVKSRGEILSPSFSNDSKLISYIEFINGRSTVYIYDLYFNKTIKLADFDGLSLRPRFSPDGKTLLFSLAQGGGTNIYEINLSNKKARRLTTGLSINLTGGYSLDGKKIIFNSDRLGRNHIYTMNRNGRNIKRISKGRGSYYNASFSPRSNLILFTKIEKNRFFIGVMDEKGKEKIISSDIFSESPSWLVDGRHIIYQYAYRKQEGSKALYSLYLMDIVSNYKIELKPSRNSQDPNISKEAIWNKKIVGKYNF